MSGSRRGPIHDRAADARRRPGRPRIYEEGIATGIATLENEAPGWARMGRLAPARLPARRAQRRTRRRLDRARAPRHRGVYAGVAWLSVTSTSDQRPRRRAGAPRGADPGVGGGGHVDTPGRASSPTTGRASRSTSGRASGGSASRSDRARPPGRWRDVVLLERRSQRRQPLSSRVAMRRRRPPCTTSPAAASPAAPHPAPRPGRLALRRGAVRGRGLHRPQLAAVPPRPADPDPQDRAGPADQARAADDDLHRHRLTKTGGVEPSGDAITGRVPLYFNNDVVFGVVRPADAMPDGRSTATASPTRCCSSTRATGVCDTIFGPLRYGPGDYLVLPIGTTWRLEPDTGSEQRMLYLEAPSEIEPPKRYRNDYGQLLEHSPYSQRDIHAPERSAPRR